MGGTKLNICLQRPELRTKLIAGVQIDELIGKLRIIDAIISVCKCVYKHVCVCVCLCVTS